MSLAKPMFVLTASMVLVDVVSIPVASATTVPPTNG